MPNSPQIIQPLDVQIARAVTAVQGGEAGAVTLALVGTLANATLTARLREFREQFPGVDLRLRTALSDEVTSLVLRGEAALGLRYGPTENPGLTCVTATTNGW